MKNKIKKDEKRIVRKVYYLYPREIKKVDGKAKELSKKTKQRISGSIVIRDLIKTIPE